jgi:hypothetical protein
VTSRLEPGREGWISRDDVVLLQTCAESLKRCGFAGADRELHDLAGRIALEVEERRARQVLGERRGGTVDLQTLLNAGLNAFAAKLLAESYRKHENAPPVRFAVDGVEITLSLWPPREGEGAVAGDEGGGS